MPQTITKGYKALLAEAEREIATLDVAEVQAMLGREDVLLVDIRDPRELEREGRMPGAFHCTRGMLEFWIDPRAPTPSLRSRRTRPSCSSARAAGARRSLRRRRRTWGSSPVAHMRGGFGAWKQAGGPVEDGARPKG